MKGILARHELKKANSAAKEELMNTSLRELLSLYATRMETIPKEFQRGWRIVLEKQDGTLEELNNDVALLSLVNPRFGRVTYGKSPHGKYDAWAIHEPGGGGAATIPFARINGELYVGLLEEKRLLQTASGLAWNTVMGFLEPGQSHFETAENELAEEMGMKPLSERIRLLPGEPGNHNSSNVETWWGENEGFRFYSYEFLPQELREIGPGRWRPKQELKPKLGTGEKILRCEFMPWHEAMLVGDMQTMSAIGRLMVAERNS